MLKTIYSALLIYKTGNTVFEVLSKNMIFRWKNCILIKIVWLTDFLEHNLNILNTFIHMASHNTFNGLKKIITCRAVDPEQFILRIVINKE